MKYLIFSIALIFLFSSCDPDLPVKDVGKKKYELDIPNTSASIYEYTIDGCEYFGDLGGDSRDDFLTHKGNCSNPIHK